MKAMEKKPSLSHRVSRHGLPGTACSTTVYVQRKQKTNPLTKNFITRSNISLDHEVSFNRAQRARLRGVLRSPLSDSPQVGKVVSVRSELSSRPVLARKPEEVKSSSEERLPAELEKRIDRIEAIIAEKWKKYIDKVKFSSPLKERITWYEDKKKLFKAKWELARTLAERDADAMDENEKKAAIEKHRYAVSSASPGFDDVRRYVVMGKQNSYYKALGGDEVPAFYNQFDERIHTSSGNVDVIAHEALHFYNSTEFREVFGAELDEGMTQYLAEQVAYDYLGRYIREGGITFTITSYSDTVALIKDLIQSGKLKKRTAVRGYFSGEKKLLRQMKKSVDAAKAVKTKK